MWSMVTLTAEHLCALCMCRQVSRWHAIKFFTDFPPQIMMNTHYSSASEVIDDYCSEDVGKLSCKSINFVNTYSDIGISIRLNILKDLNWAALQQMSRNSACAKNFV